MLVKSNSTLVYYDFIQNYPFVYIKNYAKKLLKSVPVFCFYLYS